MLIGWVFFRVQHVRDAWGYIRTMFGHSAADARDCIPDMEWKVTFYIALFFTFFVLLWRGQKIQDTVYGIQPLRVRGHLVMTAVAMVLFVLSLSYVTGSTFNPFIYFRF